jgi:hypothetical protein
MMVDDSFPNITSFMIRFTQDSSAQAAGQPVYRGLIRHVQTDNEIVFTRWEDAIAFIEQFVPLEGISRTPQKNSQSEMSKTDNMTDNIDQES